MGGKLWCFDLVFRPGRPAMVPGHAGRASRPHRPQAAGSKMYPAPGSLSLQVLICHNFLESTGIFTKFSGVVLGVDNGKFH